MKRYTLVPKMNPDTHKFITKNVISKETVLNYLIIIPCVNRLERNAVNKELFKVLKMVVSSLVK